MDQLLKDIKLNNSWNIILVVDVANSGLIDEFLFEAAMRLLPLKQQSKILARKSAMGKHTMLCNRLLQLFGCSISTGKNISQLVFQAGKHGKPMLQNANNVAFNMSNGDNHTVMYLIKGSSTGGDVGVDIASVDDLGEDLELFKNIFHRDEYTYLLELPPVERRCLFAYYWSLKESYTKYVGTGLHNNLNDINFKEQKDFRDEGRQDVIINNEHLTFYSRWLPAERKEEKDIITVCHSANLNMNKPKMYSITFNSVFDYLQSQI